MFQGPLILRPGDRVIPVGQVQEQLNTVLYAGLMVDNIFGPATEAALREFQRMARLPETGIVDQATWYRLFSGDPLPAEAAVSPEPELNAEKEPAEEFEPLQAPDQYSIEIDRGRRILTLFRGGTRVAYFSVAVGKPATPTPLGNFRIRNKAVNPGGPFGTRWLGLTTNGIGIHGTNAPSSIGLAVSNGCIRMYNQDIEYLFPLVSVGTPVRIIRGVEAAVPPRTYTVRPADSLYLIAQRFGTTVAALRAANNLPTDVIFPGQTLVIPEGAAPGPPPPPPSPPVPAAPDTITYVVRPGDTLFRIAQSFNTTIATLRRLNNLSGDLITPGQVLRVPAPALTTRYVVQPGDTLYLLAQRFGTTVSELRALNNLTTDILRVGQVLEVPVPR
ncbi:MAG: LysM peptidoglycan-binding domain-containing protein [Clostridia bacterium]|nr:LysM peptidoglycan-binding domain-containing protein [Clostridia bacterium]